MPIRLSQRWIGKTSATLSCDIGNPPGGLPRLAHWLMWRWPSSSQNYRLPLLYCSAGLALDSVNLAIPAPDLLGFAVRTVRFGFNPDGSANPAEFSQRSDSPRCRALVFFALAALSLRRALRLSPMFRQRSEGRSRAGSAGEPGAIGRDSIRRHRGGNGDRRDHSAATGRFCRRILQRRRLWNRNRQGDNMGWRGANGHIEPLADARRCGIPRRFHHEWRHEDWRADIASTLGISRSSQGSPSVGAPTESPNDKNSFGRSRLQVRTICLKSSRSCRTPSNSGEKFAHRQEDAKSLTWREWIQMPFIGPLFMSGFLAGLINMMLLGPLVSIAWRQRKYAADATAVQLTRDPDNLDGALSAITNAGASIALPDWATHLCVVQPGKDRVAAIGAGRIVSLCPSVERRHRALVRFGASDRRASSGMKPMPFWAWLF